MPPRKVAKRNISGLRNQPKPVSTPPVPSVPEKESVETSDNDFPPGFHFESMRVDWENDDESDIGSEWDLDDWDDEELGIKLAVMAEKQDSRDLDWVPPRLRVKPKEKKDRPRHYNTTSDGLNKAQSTAYSVAVWVWTLPFSHL
ncbi:hypothetical protein DFH06DRAFT_1350506 [Mycena polygramma]|nr:hypothetical protein DFH06DRAFT_1350506 [Mycena polygramma]